MGIEFIFFEILGRLSLLFERMVFLKAPSNAAVPKGTHADNVNN